MRKIVRDLLNQKNIEKSLVEYYARFMEINNTYSHIRLAMNYYTCYISVSEENGMVPPGYLQYMDTINTVIDKVVNQKSDSLQEEIQQLESLRCEMMEKVKDITCYVDRYNLYEYIINRMEYRFKETDFPKEYSDVSYTRKLMQFILEQDDSMMINSKIKDVVGQLPVKMTKSKFYERLSNGLSIYKGGTRESLKDFLYMIRSVSTLEDTDSMNFHYPYLSEYFSELKAIDYRVISKQQCEKAREHLENITDYIDSEMNNCMMVQEVLNDLLLLLYTQCQKKESDAVDVCEEIMRETNLLFTGKFSHKTTDEIENMFVSLEGLQEELYPQISSCDITEHIREHFQKEIHMLGMEEQYRILYRLPKLNSDSIFAELEKHTDNTVADENFVQQEMERLREEYAKLFAENDRWFQRAVMSAVLSELPVFFHNISELQDFIYNTLSTCTDLFEKQACIEILNSVMES